VGKNDKDLHGAAKTHRLRLATRVPDALILNLATVGFFGKAKRAPGTVGSLAGVVLAGLLWWGTQWYGWLGFGLILLVLMGLTILICGEAEVILGLRDPGRIVLDECVAVPIALAGIPWLGEEPVLVALFLLAAFVLFRFFDILKPWPIGRLQALPGGWGVALDDFAAALPCCFILNAVYWFAL